MGVLANALRTFIPQFWRSNGAGGLTSALDARTYQEHVADAIEQLEANGTASKWYEGSGAPAPALGKVYDQYLDNDTGDTWAYDVAVGWQRTGNLHGKDGHTPVKGVDYFDGRTPVKGVDYFDGHTPVKGVDYRDGADGHTPVKGVDYFDGVDGNRISAPSAAPAPSDGQAGDLAIVASTGDLQEKTASGWVTRGNLKGPKGDAGTGTGTGSGSTNGVTLVSTGDGSKYLNDAGSYTKPAAGASLAAQSGATTGKFLKSSGVAGSESWETPVSNRREFSVLFSNTQTSEFIDFRLAAQITLVGKSGGIASASYSVNGALAVPFSFTSGVDQRGITVPAGGQLVITSVAFANGGSKGTLFFELTQG